MGIKIKSIQNPAIGAIEHFTKLFRNIKKILQLFANLSVIPSLQNTHRLLFLF